MNRKIIISFIIFLLLLFLDFSISSYTKFLLSVGFLSLVIIIIDFPHNLLFAFFAGLFYDLFMSSVSGTYVLICLFGAIIVYLVESAYAFKSFILQLIFIIIFFSLAFFISRDFETFFRFLSLSVAFALPWSMIKMLWDKRHINE